MSPEHAPPLRRLVIPARSPSSGAGTGKWRRWKVLIALSAPVVGLLLCEVLLRWLLFSGSPLAERWGLRFRDAGLYLSTNICDDYFELIYLFSTPERRRMPILPQRELGWVSTTLDPETLRHPDEERVAGRRPALLFGSSYAVCWFQEQACFQQLLERSDLARDHCLLNFGVGAYGLDQVVLLAGKVVPRFAALDPVVILTVVVDADLPRSQVAFFMAPKPRFVAQAGEFRLRLPDELDPQAFIERHPPEIRSYAWRYLAHALGLLEESSAARQQRVAERRGLAAFCLGRAHAELEAHGIEHFVVLFHSASAFPPLGMRHEDEQLLIDYLKEQRIPFVDTRPILEQECERSGADVRELYAHDPGDAWHPNVRGTEVLFRAFRLGLERRYDAPR